LLIVEMVAKPSHAMAREDAEHVSLVVVKFRWRITTETQEFIAEESLHTRERQMREFRAAVQQCVNALDKC
jgi:Zn-dependent M16 (insulinase) family peptidase